jgi:hypothetical protein
MSYETLRRALADLDAEVARLRLTIPATNPLSGQVQLMREVLADSAALDQDAFFEGWKDRYNERHSARIAVARLTSVVVELRGLPRLKAVLRKVSGSRSPRTLR